MYNPGCSTTSQAVPDMQMIQRFAMTLNISECQLEEDSSMSRTPDNSVPTWRDGYHLLNNPNSMMHVPGTYDTYTCKDCNIVLSGYKRGDPFLNEHVQSGGGKCRYITMKFRGRETDLLVLQGKLRFQRGVLAFPEYMLYAIDGYIDISGIRYCIICSCQFGENHYMACSDMSNRLKANLKDLKLPVSISETPLFMRDPRYVYRGDQLQTKSSDEHVTTDLSLLGESANMYHLPHTVDTHKCVMCKLKIKSFVENDTLLGEHIYHVYNTDRHCQYIAELYRIKQHQLMPILGEERFKKGYIAFPDTICKAAYGYTVIQGQHLCVICSAITIQGKHLPPQGHFPHCHAMTKMLTLKLEHMNLLL